MIPHFSTFTSTIQMEKSATWSQLWMLMEPSQLSPSWTPGKFAQQWGRALGATYNLLWMIKANSPPTWAHKVTHGTFTIMTRSLRHRQRLLSRSTLPALSQEHLISVKITALFRHQMRPSAGSTTTTLLERFVTYKRSSARTEHSKGGTSKILGTLAPWLLTDGLMLPSFTTGTAQISPTCSDSALRATSNGTSTLMTRSSTQRTKTRLKSRFKFTAQSPMKVNSTMTTLTHCLRHMSLPSNGSTSTIQKGPFVIYRQTSQTNYHS